MNINEKKRRIRVKLKAKSDKPRLSVFRSNRHLYAQVIDNNTGEVICSASDFELKTKSKGIKQAEKIGQLIAEKATKKKVKEIAFDRSGYKYHGLVKALAEGARKKGLKF